MRKPITFAIVFIIAFTSAITGQPLNNTASNAKANSKREELPEGAEAAKAIARLDPLAPAAIRERLQQLRPQAFLPKADHINQLIKRLNLTIETGRRVDQTKAVLQPVLDYHGRNQMPIYVLWSEQPQAYLVERAVIIITTRLLDIAREDELRGIIAHELAHEYVWNARSEAMSTHGKKLMRECELFCDAIAAFTLKELGNDPASYIRILEQLTKAGNREGHFSQLESDTHPSLDERRKLNEFLCQRLE